MRKREKMLQMKNLIIILLILTLFISCKNDLTINIEAQKINDKKVKTTITTNFPENTVFSITATRIYKRKNNPNYYSGVHYFSRELAVKNGIIEFSFDVNDKDWIDSYNNFRESENQFDKELTEIDFKSIQDSLEISVFYEPRLERDYEVKKVLGEKGEKIRGKGTIEIDDYNVFNEKIKIYDRFER